ncbi:MAG: response regulator transcription factor [Gemmatimonadales bacterium]
MSPEYRHHNRNAPGLIAVVDDDDSIRESLQGLLQSIGFAVETFPSAQAFLDSECLPRTDCLILDVRMPDMRGPDLQRELIRRRSGIPIVFITAHGDEEIRPRVLSDGAVDCLLKPFSEEALLRAIRLALPPQ